MDPLLDGPLREAGIRTKPSLFWTSSIGPIAAQGPAAYLPSRALIFRRLHAERRIILERDKLQMKIESRGAVSFAWSQAKQLAGEVYKLDVDDVLKERYATLFILAAASRLRCAELFALRINDLDFKAGTIRVDESADQRTYIIEPCKNVAACRWRINTVAVNDRIGETGCN